MFSDTQVFHQEKKTGEEVEKFHEELIIGYGQDPLNDA
jgi:hypothetical protein